MPDSPFVHRDTLSDIDPGLPTVRPQVELPAAKITLIPKNPIVFAYRLNPASFSLY